MFVENLKKKCILVKRTSLNDTRANVAVGCENIMVTPPSDIQFTQRHHNSFRLDKRPSGVYSSTVSDAPSGAINQHEKHLMIDRARGGWLWWFATLIFLSL